MGDVSAPGWRRTERAMYRIQDGGGGWRVWGDHPTFDEVTRCSVSLTTNKDQEPEGSVELNLLWTRGV